MSVMERRAWEELPMCLTALASGIEARQPHDTLIALLEQTQALCREGEGAGYAEALAHVLVQVRTAAETWQRVWPRLGGDREFRLAVAREARLWAKRFAEQTKP